MIIELVKLSTASLGRQGRMHKQLQLPRFYSCDAVWIWWYFRLSIAGWACVRIILNRNPRMCGDGKEYKRGTTCRVVNTRFGKRSHDAEKSSANEKQVFGFHGPTKRDG